MIPKVDNPDNLGQFRRVSLCNIIYKIASKAVANRLKVIVPEIISEEQSMFASGLLITDKIITVYECMHFIKNMRVRDTRDCALKLDMKKACNRVEWDYLQSIMIKLGFHRLWVDMVMRLISTISFSILFNGAKMGTPSYNTPIDIRNSSNGAFKYLKDRIWKRV